MGMWVGACMGVQSRCMGGCMRGCMDGRMDIEVALVLFHAGHLVLNFCGYSNTNSHSKFTI